MDAGSAVDFIRHFNIPPEYPEDTLYERFGRDIRDACALVSKLDSEKEKFATLADRLMNQCAEYQAAYEEAKGRILAYSEDVPVLIQQIEELEADAKRLRLELSCEKLRADDAERKLTLVRRL